MLLFVACNNVSEFRLQRVELESVANNETICPWPAEWREVHSRLGRAARRVGQEIRQNLISVGHLRGWLYSRDEIGSVARESLTERLEEFLKVVSVRVVVLLYLITALDVRLRSDTDDVRLK